LQVGGAVAAAELDDPDAFAVSGSTRKTIERCELDRRERGRGSRLGVPLHIAVRRADAKVRVRLRTVVEAEHRRHHAVQLVRQMYRSRPTAIGAAGMLECFEIDIESAVELGNRAGEHDGPACGVFLDDHEAVRVGELPDCGNVRRISPELLRELLAAQVTTRLFALGQLGHSVFQDVALAMAQDDADFQPFRGIGLADGSRSAHRLSLATSKWMFRHR
jgi:hypothetical protein